MCYKIPNNTKEINWNNKDKQINKADFTMQKICYDHRLTNNKPTFSQSVALNWWISQPLVLLYYSVTVATVADNISYSSKVRDMICYPTNGVTYPERTTQF